MAAVLTKSWFLLPVIILNIFGTIWGFFWYENQLTVTAWQKLLFVPDCPLHAFFFALFAYWLFFKDRMEETWRQLIAWAGVLGSIKYGVWTVVILGQYFMATGQPPAGDDLLLFVSHTGMLLQGLAYLRYLPATGLPAVLAITWLAVNDGFDYLGGTHPNLPLSEQFLFAGGLSLIMTMTITVITVIFFRLFRCREQR